MITPAPALPNNVAEEIRLYELIDQAARALHRNTQDGYTDGYERTLTDNVLSTHLPAGDHAVRDRTLWTLAYNKLSEFINVDCLLSEVDETSYQTAREMTDLLVSAVHAQGRERIALTDLVCDLIISRSRMDSVTSGRAAPYAGEIAEAVLNGAAAAGRVDHLGGDVWVSRT